MKKLLHFTLCLLCYANLTQAETNSFMGDFPSSTTYDFEVDGCYYNILSLSDLTVELTCHWVNEDVVPAYSGNFRVPETVVYSNRTFRVTQINRWAFCNCTFTTLTIPATIHAISGGIIGYGECQNLVIEDSEEILSVPRDGMVSQVHNSVYLGRHLDGYIVYPYKTYYSGINQYCGGAYETITFGNLLSEVGELCVNCQNLTTVTLPTNIKKLSYTFRGCSNLTTVSGEGVEVLDNALNESGIQTINMPNLKIILGAFRSCTALQTMNIPEGVAWMGGVGDEYYGVFTNATSLTSVLIPATVLSIANKSFVGCSSLSTISVAHATPINIAENTFDMMTYLNATLKVPAGTRTTYMNAPVWKNFSNIVEDPTLISTMATICLNTQYNSELGGTVEITIPDPKTSFDTNNIYDLFEYDGYTVPIGTTVTFTATAEQNYQLDSMLINDINVTAQMQNNAYTYTVSHSTLLDIEAYFSWGHTHSIITADASSENISRKLFRDSQIIILRKDRTFTITGQEIK